MLAFSPARRISVDDALAHPYLAALHDPEDEPVAATPFSFPFDSETLTEETVRILVTVEVERYRSQRAREDAAAAAQGGAH